MLAVRAIRPIFQHEAPVSRALQEFFSAVEEEFGVAVDADCDVLRTPAEVIAFIVSETTPSDGMTPDEHRDHVSAVVGEIMAQTMGITRYTDDSRFVEDLHVR